MMQIIEKLWELAKQRRVWVAAISGTVAVCGALGYAQAAEMIVALAAAGGLSVWSYTLPKK